MSFSRRSSFSSSRLLRLLGPAALALATVLGSAGCSDSSEECGAGPVPSEHRNGAKVTKDGVVVFDQVIVGNSVTFDLPVKDTADVDETLIGATLQGDDADAFDVEAKFPIDMPAGKQVHVEVTFHPKRSGDLKATLIIETENMGPSPAIELRGVGADSDGF